MIGTRLRPVPRISARLVGIFLGAVALLGVASCGGRAPIRIGLQGTYGDPLGRPQRFGAQLAVSQINAAGGIHGRLIELVVPEAVAWLPTGVHAASPPCRGTEDSIWYFFPKTLAQPTFTLAPSAAREMVRIRRTEAA